MASFRSSVISERLPARCLLLLAVVLLAGCTKLFFVPLRQQVYTPQQLGVAVEDIRLTAADGTQLFAWRLPVSGAAPPRGVVCYFHGNAENISTHTLNVAWLPATGHEVLAVDYRGYGASQGKPEFPAVFADVRAGLDWCLARGRELDVPVFALGQSLGAALLLDAVAREPYRTQLRGVVADSGFANYRRIARDALSHSWLTIPFKYPLSWLVTGQHNAEDAVRTLAPLPLLVMHSPDDRVVPFAHGETLAAAATGPHCFRRTGGAHNAAFRDTDNRRAVLDFFAAAEALRASGKPLACAGIESHDAPSPAAAL